MRIGADINANKWRAILAVAATAIFIAATVTAILQQPSNTLQQRETSAWEWFFGVEEKNSYLRADPNVTPNARVFGLNNAGRLWLLTSRYVLSSEDYGETWQSDHLPIRSNAFYYGDIDDRNQSRWYALSNFAQVVESNDEGETWNRPRQNNLSSAAVETIGQTPASVFSISSMAFNRSGRYGIAVGGDGYFIQDSSDAGHSWQLKSGAPNAIPPLVGGTEQYLYDVALTDDGRTGFAVGSLGAVKMVQQPRSEPEQQTEQLIEQQVAGPLQWRYQYLGLSRLKLLSVDTNSDGGLVVAVGESTSIYRSTDLGDTWTQVEFYWPQKDRPLNGNYQQSESVQLTDYEVTAGEADPTQINLSVFDRDSRNHTFRTVAVSPRGDVVIVAGGNKNGNGIALRSSDGGQSWQDIGDNFNTEIRQLRLADDGLTAYAVGGAPARNNRPSTGAIFKSTDGGETWRAINVNVDPVPLLTSIYLSGTAQTIIATTANGRLLTSVDGGQQWSLGPDYEASPAPWYYAALTLAFMLAAGTLRLPKTETFAAEGEFYDSDAPVADRSKDKLHFTPIAESISSYLRNPGTQPPLNLAITAPWGSGKSSLMNLLVDDLKKHNYRTVWFNAWHHQSEDHLLASLLEAICEQGIPKWWRPEGVLFYTRLLFVRLIRDFSNSRALMFLMPLILLIAIVVGTGAIDNSEVENNLESLGQSGAFLSFGLWVWFRIKAIAVKPAKLIAKLSSRYSIKHFKDQLSFRHNFIAEFNDVSKALAPTSLVIVIDDLDRCQPKQILEILESINFLMNAGRCFVVFGMDASPVLASLELEFDDIAAKLAQYDKSRIQNARDYARNYLEKMVNIEIPVPRMDQLEEASSDTFFKPVRKETSNAFKRQRLLQRAINFVNGAFLLLAMVSFVSLSGWIVGNELTNVASVSCAMGLKSVSFIGKICPDKTESAAQDKVTRTDGRTADLSAAVPSRASPVEDLTDEELLDRSLIDADALPQFETRDINLAPLEISNHWLRSNEWLWAVLLIVSVFLAIAFGEWRRWSSAVSRDSPEFVDALSQWLLTLRESRTTPRALKRFSNRVRFLSMLQNNVEEDKQIPQKLLVGLGVLTAQVEDSIKQRVDISLFFDERGQFDETKTRELLKGVNTDKLQETIDTIRSEHGWPPSEAQFATFRKLSSGVLIR